MDTEARLTKLERDLVDLNEEFYRSNFTSQQDMNKFINCTVRFKVPVVTALPATCQIGELISYGGKLYVASAVNTWVVAGTQS